MRPRIVANVQGIEQVDEAFANSADGWAAAWARWAEITALSATTIRGEATFEFCAHGEQPAAPCALVAREEWGEWDG